MLEKDEAARRHEVIDAMIGWKGSNGSVCENIVRFNKIWAIQLVCVSETDATTRLFAKLE